MSRKTLIALIALVALLVAGVLVAGAQDTDTSDTTPPYGYGMMRGGHFGPMMGGGFGPGMMFGEGQPMIATVADALDLDATTLLSELNAGKTLAAVAEEQGVEMQAIYDAVLAQAAAHMSALVEAGTITTEQMAARLSFMQENIAEMPFLSGEFGACCLGSQNRFGPGGMHGMRGGHGRMMGQGWNR